MNGERVMSPGERSAYANGWQARDKEVAQLRIELEIWKQNVGDVLLRAEVDELRAEIERLQGEIDVLLSKSKEAT